MSKQQELRDMISELLDYDSELTDSEIIFLTTIKDYSDFTLIQYEKVEKIYDKIFEGTEKDAYDVWELDEN